MKRVWFVWRCWYCSRRNKSEVNPFQYQTNYGYWYELVCKKCGKMSILRMRFNIEPIDYDPSKKEFIISKRKKRKKRKLIQ